MTYFWNAEWTHSLLVKQWKWSFVILNKAWLIDSSYWWPVFDLNDNMKYPITRKLPEVVDLYLKSPSLQGNREHMHPQIAFLLQLTFSNIFFCFSTYGLVNFMTWSKKKSIDDEFWMTVICTYIINLGSFGACLIRFQNQIEFIPAHLQEILRFE